MPKETQDAERLDGAALVDVQTCIAPVNMDRDLDAQPTKEPLGHLLEAVELTRIGIRQALELSGGFVADKGVMCMIKLHLEAATAAASYVHPKVTPQVQRVKDIDALTDEELMAILGDSASPRGAKGNRKMNRKLI